MKGKDVSTVPRIGVPAGAYAAVLEPAIIRRAAVALGFVALAQLQWQCCSL